MSGASAKNDERPWVREWQAKRSGGRITVTGRGPGGGPVKIPNVDTITPDSDKHSCIAVDKDKKEFRLIVV